MQITVTYPTAGDTVSTVIEATPDDDYSNHCNSIAKVMVSTVIQSIATVPAIRRFPPRVRARVGACSTALIPENEEIDL